MQAEPPPSASLDLAAMIPDVKVPAGLTLGALVGGLAIGLLLAGRAEAGGVIALTGPVGALSAGAATVVSGRQLPIVR